MLTIQLQWKGSWVEIATGFTTHDDAEWAIAEWRQLHCCEKDPFRVVQNRVVQK